MRLQILPQEKYPALRAAKGAHSSARNTLDTVAFATGGPASASPLTGDDSGGAAWKYRIREVPDASEAHKKHIKGAAYLQ
ncbi:hypothetical protein MTO96_038166, partial [Rhipicephalus appendiculatus]